MTDRAQPPHVRQWQQVMNEHFPLEPDVIPKLSIPRDVRVRLFWHDSSSEWLEGRLIQSGGSHMFVEVRDPQRRLPTLGVWVKPCDVYARPHTPAPPRDDPSRRRPT